MQVESTRLYRVRDVAEHFDVSVATIYRAIGSGQLQAFKLGAGIGTFRVSGASVLAYAEACVRAAYQAWFPVDDCGQGTIDRNTPDLAEWVGPEVAAVVPHER